MSNDITKKEVLSHGRVTALRAIFLPILFFVIFLTNPAEATDGLRSFLKVAPPLVEPNVLFFIDSSGSMLWPMDALPDESEPAKSTFGDGTLGWQQGHKFIQEYYGLDTDLKNNIPDNLAKGSNHLNLQHYHDQLVWQRGGAERLDTPDLDKPMPNDSRAYIAKLVLWRILGDKDLIAGLRIGFGTYIQTFYGASSSGGKKIGLEADMYRYPHNGKDRIKSGQDVSPGYDSASSTRRYIYVQGGTNYNNPEISPGTNKHYDNSWQISSGVNILNNANNRRGMLRTDFESFVKADGTLDKNLLQTKFFRWIDGVEEYSDSDCTATNYARETANPEIRFDGWRPLAEAIFYRDGAEVNKGTSNLTIEGRREGSIDQFFTLISGNKPVFITNHCQEQWLVFMTSGGQSIYPKTVARDPVTAVQKLYNTKVKVDTFAGKDRYSRPIRTVIIGFVDPKSTNPSVVDTRTQLNNMADMGDDGLLNGTATAYFATDVPSILSAMKKIIASIRAGSGTNNAPLPSPATGTGDDEKAAIYQSTFIGRADAHWRGDIVKKLFDGDTNPLIWSAANMLQQMNWKLRKIYIPTLLIPKLNADNENLTLLSDNLATDLAPVLGIQKQGTGNQTKDFIQWFRGDNTYSETERFKLFDIYNSGVAVIGPPNARARVGDASYGTFAATYKDRPKIIYAQSNAGLLHAFNDTDGAERWAFMPPNALVKGRIRGLKGSWSGTAWQYDATKKSYSRYITDGPIVPADVEINSSYRTVLLGLLGLGGAGMYAVDITNVDITNVDKPRFLWAVENDIYVDNAKKLLTMDSQDIKGINERKVRLWRQNGNSVEESIIFHKNLNASSEWNYKDLCFTLSVPRIGHVMIDTIVDPIKKWVFIMGNGFPNGESTFTSGGVFVSDIATGEIINLLKPRVDLNAGSFTAPITTLFEDSGKRIKTFFAADSKNGIVFKGDLSSTDPKDWSLEKIFAIRSLPNVDPGDIGFAFSLKVEKFYDNYWLFAGTDDGQNFMGSSTSARNYFVAVNLKDLKTQQGTLEILDPSKPQEIALNNDGWYIKLGEGEYLTAAPTVYNGYVFFATFIKGNDPCNPDVGTAKLYGIKGTNGKGVVTDEGAKFTSYPNIRISGISFMGDKVLLGTSSTTNSENQGPLKIIEQSTEVKASFTGEGSIPAGTYIEGLPSRIPGSKEMLPLYWKER